MKIKKNDNVKIIAGKDKGKKGKVLQILSKEEMVVVEGINMMAKNVRPKKQGEKGQVVRYNAPIHVSKVILFCAKCNKGVKISFIKKGESKKTRVCRKCKQTL